MTQRPTIPRPLAISMVAAFLIGLVFLFWSPLRIPPQFESYDALGWNLSQGEGFSFYGGEQQEPFIFRTPGYPLFLAAFYRLFGHHPWVIYLAQALLHALTLVWVYALSHRFLGDRTAAVATFLVALYPLTAFYVPTILPETLSTFLVAFSLWLYWKSAASGSRGLMLLTGLVMGYSALVRPVFGLFPLACLAWSFWVHRSRGEILRVFLSLHAGFFLVLSPWIIRNYSVSGEFIPLSSEAPLQFWLGTINVGPYANRHWENPIYHPQELIVNRRGEYFFDRDDVPFLLEVRARHSEPLSPVTLHYRSKEGGAFQSVPLEKVGPGTLRAKIPPQGYGQRVEFFFTFRDPWAPVQVLRYPEEPGRYFYYRVEKTILADLKMEGLLDIYDLGELSNRLFSMDGASPEARRRLDLDTDGLLTPADLRLLLHRLGQPSNALPAIEPLGPQQIRLAFSDGGHLVLPRASGRPKDLLREIVSDKDPRRKGILLASVASLSPSSYIPAGGWYVPEKPCGEENPSPTETEEFHLLLDHVTGDFSDNPRFVPCILRIGLLTLHQELRINRSYMALAWQNLGMDPWGYVKASLARIPRLWVTVGRGDSGQTYPIAGGSLSYLLLQALTTTLLLLALAGFLIKIKPWRTHLLLALPILYLSLVHAPFHPEGRYSIPGRPFLLVYVAITLLALWDFLRGHRREAR